MNLREWMISHFVRTLVHRGLVGGKPLNLGNSCYMQGPRRRGRIAIESPVALQPVPPAKLDISRDLCIFLSGFVTAILFIFWILFDTFYVD